jgi:hypothetical protein
MRSCEHDQTSTQRAVQSGSRRTCSGSRQTIPQSTQTIRTHLVGVREAHSERHDEQRRSLHAADFLSSRARRRLGRVSQQWPPRLFLHYAPPSRRPPRAPPCRSPRPLPERLRRAAAAAAALRPRRRQQRSRRRQRVRLLGSRFSLRLLSSTHSQRCRCQHRDRGSADCTGSGARATRCRAVVAA